MNSNTETIFGLNRLCCLLLQPKLYVHQAVFAIFWPNQRKANSWNRANNKGIRNTKNENRWYIWKSSFFFLFAHVPWSWPFSWLRFALVPRLICLHVARCYYFLNTHFVICSGERRQRTPWEKLDQTTNSPDRTETSWCPRWLGRARTLTSEGRTKERVPGNGRKKKFFEIAGVLRMWGITA